MINEDVKEFGDKLRDMLTMSPDCSNEDVVHKIYRILIINQKYKKKLFMPKDKEIAEFQDKLHRRNMQIKNLQAQVKKLINERNIYEKYVSSEQLSADDIETLTNS